jgi:lipopolysaccharide export LptBFGC system permease protein LptF
MNPGNYFWKCAVAGVIGLLFLGVVTFFLWNWLVPSLFNGPVITFWQAMGLLILSKIITGGFWSWKRRAYDGHQKNHLYWKNRLDQKLSSLNPADRDAFKQKMKEKWCRWEKESSASSND